MMGKVTINDILEIINELDVGINVSELDVNKNLTSQGMDSLDSMNLFFQLEEMYNVSISEDDVSNGVWNTIASIVKNINASLKASSDD